jgi:hypothetical protein
VPLKNASDDPANPLGYLLTLTLLVPRVAANHENDAAATDNLAMFTNALDAGADFHGWPLD